MSQSFTVTIGDDITLGRIYRSASKKNISKEDLIKRALLVYLKLDEVITEGSANLELISKSDDGSIVTKYVVWD